MQPNNINATQTQWKYSVSKVNSSINPPHSLDRKLVSDTSYTPDFTLFYNVIEDKFEHLEKKIDILQANFRTSIVVHRLMTYNLSTGLEIVIESDDDGVIARSPDLPLYGYGDDMIEAIDNLKFEIESLYNDLMEDDNFTEDWFIIKSFLQKVIIR